MSAIYEAEDLRKYYGSRLALDLDEFYLASGEAIILTGANGSGKSTLLRLLAFLEQPSSGSLRFIPPCSSPRRQVTLLLQEPYLLKETVFRNVTLGLALRGKKNDLKTSFARAMLAAGFTKPEKFACRRPGQLSGGEKQRVALASRLILDPLALLLDEPTSNVDAASAKTIISALERFQADGGSIVCATHDIQLMGALAGRQIALKVAAD